MTNSLRCFRETRIALTYFRKEETGKTQVENNSRKTISSLWTIDRLSNLLGWAGERGKDQKKVFLGGNLAMTCVYLLFWTLTFIWLVVLTYKMLFLVLSWKLIRNLPGRLYIYISQISHATYLLSVLDSWAFLLSCFPTLSWGMMSGWDTVGGKIDEPPWPLGIYSQLLAAYPW